MSIKHIIFITILFILYFCSFQSICCAQQSMDLDYKLGELIVKFAPNANSKQRTKVECEAVLASINGGFIKHSYKIVPGLTVVKLPENVTVKNVLSVFNRTLGIVYAVPNYRAEVLLSVPNDTSFDYLWGMNNTGQTGGTEDADIDAPEAWDIATDTNDIIVAVIDTGIDYNHPDLVNNIWINSAEYNEDPNAPSDQNEDGYPGVAGVDDDGDDLVDEDSNGNSRFLVDGTTPNPNYNNDLAGDDDENGYVDDIYGYDFCAYGDKERDSDPYDDEGHGTHCAGIIGAVGNNSVGVTGVCWNVNIMALKWIHATGFGEIADAIACIDYAVDMGAQVLSNSWWWPDDVQPLEEAIEAARDAGVLFIASAGNFSGSTAVYPARYEFDNIISVMATDHNDILSDFVG